MDLSLFMSGVVAGFAIAAPVGPVGVLCIRRALADGRLASFVAGLGAAAADTFYGAVVVLGISLIADFLLNHQEALALVGSFFLLGLGIRTFFAKPVLETNGATEVGLVKDFISTFFITLTNPATILAFIGVFVAGGAFSGIGNNFDAGLVIAGVAAGSTLWWFTLALAAGAFRKRFHQGWVAWLNRGSGALLLLFGIGVLVSLYTGAL